MILKDSASLNISGTVSLDGDAYFTLQNSASLNISGTLEFTRASTVNTSQGNHITVEDGGILRNQTTLILNGPVTNNGEIKNTSWITFAAPSGSPVINNGSINTDSTLDIKCEFSNGTAQNKLANITNNAGTITVRAGTLTNYGALTNNGKLEISGAGTSLVMEAGQITSSYARSAAVKVITGASFTMKGGTISSTATPSLPSYPDPAAVEVASDASFTMSGGTVKSGHIAIIAASADVLTLDASAIVKSKVQNLTLKIPGKSYEETPEGSWYKLTIPIVERP